MLEELRIQNFAIIEHLTLSFNDGFNVITGETGAGKSIIVDAVELLLGGKADAGGVRSGADKAIIEGTFALDAMRRALVLPILLREDLADPDEDAASLESVTLSREVRRSGRSSARINGLTVNAQLLREVGGVLVDIHGQSAHLSLFKARAHMDLLDRYADLLDVREALATFVESLNHDVRAEIQRLQADKETLQRRADRLRYEIEEIDAADLQTGEDSELDAERNRLGNSEQLATLAAEALALLNGEDSGDQKPAVDQLQQIAAALSKLARIDPDLSEDAELADGLATQAQELAFNVAGYADELEYNPERLNDVEERLELIRSLKRRYKADSIEALLSHREQAANELDGIDNSEERLEELRQKEDQMLRHIGELCQRISRARQVAGQQLSERVVQELQDLRMERTHFEVAMSQTEDAAGCYVGDQRYRFDATGMDQLEFMMSANPGEPLRPLAKVASGGEAARIMLALKRVLTQADETPVLIFDEIDQGIGGRVGAIVGEKLWSLSVNHQVMVVTHLPQLASYGDAHYHVRKGTHQQRTRSEVLALQEDQQRVDELAAMLGAQGEAGQQSARDLLSHARERKRELKPHANENVTPTQQKLL